MARVTRSSAANQAASQPPSQPSSATRTRKTSTVDLGQTSTASAARPTRIAASGSASRPSTTTTSTVRSVRKVGGSVASISGNNTASASSSRPLWNSAKINLTTAEGEPGTPGGALKRPAGGLIRPAGTPRPTSRQGSMLPPAPATERKRVSAGVADKSVGMEGYRPDREPLKAFLRIMPPPVGADTSASNYIQLINENEVLMVPPADHRLNPSNSTFFSGPLLRSVELQGLHLNPASHPSNPEDTTATPTSSTPPSLGTIYKFTEVFGCAPAAAQSSSNPLPVAADPNSNSQSAFFTRTTLPLVHDFLAKGENCLLFAYGPTGSGKTWTVQGGKVSEEEMGILPRVLDVVWRSLEGKGGADTKSRPPLGGRPMTSTPTAPSKLGNKVPAGKGLGVQGQVLDDLLKKSFERADALPELVPVQDGFEYSIWVSYAEVYNEKIYDLLESPVPTASNVSVSTSSTASTSTSLFGLFSAGGAKAKAAFKGMATVKRSALPLKQEKSSGNKYVAGMKEVRIGSAEGARAALDRGQANRRVYGTLANRASSRSHSIFTIKVVKTRKGAPAGDEGTASRFSIVDLAGSERQVNSGTTGDRLKEAGSINKSLMVLGQCMEVLRKNQDRPKGTKPHIVPFRHSKLTELFQSFFVGDGKAAMIVNVNPYSTSFDENSHVMKFSAVAKGVMTIKHNVPTPIASPTPEPSAQATEEVQTPIRREESRVVRLSMLEGGEEEEVLYEEEDADEEDDGEEDEFVNALLEELSALRTALFESQMNSIMAASQARARTVEEYEKKMRDMERDFQERLREEALESELKLNAKLDILTRLQAGTRASNDTPGTNSTYDDSDEEDSFVSEIHSRGEEVNEDEEEVEKLLLVEDGNTSLLAESMGSPSPLAARASALAQGARSPIPSSKLAQLSIAVDEEDEEDEEDEQNERSDEEGTDGDTEIEVDGDASRGSIEDPLVQEGESFDQSFDDDEDEEVMSSDEEYEPEEFRVKPASASKKGAASSSASKPKKLLAPLPAGNFEVDMEVPLKGGESDDEDGDVGASYALDKSLVIRPGSAKTKKPKRKLGGNSVKDVDVLEAIADDFSPLPSKSAASSMGSARSFRR